MPKAPEKAISAAATPTPPSEQSCIAFIIPLEEAALSGYAFSLYDQTRREYNSSGIGDGEVEQHLRTANQSLSRGDFLAAAYDTLQSRGYLLAQLSLFSLPKESANEAGILALLNGSVQNASAKFSSQWAEIYFAHSEYSVAEKNRTSQLVYLVNSLKLRAFSSLLEDNFAKISSGNYSLPAPINQTANESASKILPEIIPRTVPTAEIPVALPSASASPEEQVSVSASVQPSQSPLFFAAIFLVVGALVATLVFLAASIFSRKKVPMDQQLDRLDKEFLEGRLSTESYERLAKKYFGHVILPPARPKTPAAKAKPARPAAKKAGKRI